MVWHIIVFSCVFVLLILQQYQIDKMRKRTRKDDELIEKLRQAMLLVLRGSSSPEEFEEQTKRESVKLQ